MCEDDGRYPGPDSRICPDVRNHTTFRSLWVALNSRPRAQSACQVATRIWLILVRAPGYFQESGDG